jgi:hypothetical protein
MTILDLMHDIRNLNAVLPEFQREYVWNREQAKQLMVSLFKGYPTGSLLFWKTSNPPEIKNNAVSHDKIGTTSVILDGQQRLTTLYLLTQNAIPPYYTEADIKEDPRGLHFDLDTADFQYFQLKRMQANPTWVAVTSCFEPGSVKVFEIAKAKAAEGDDPFVLAERYNANLTQLRNLLHRSYPVQTVPPEANIDDAIDVFDRVNSLGTKLSEAELALAHITGKWPQARQRMKDKGTDLASHHFEFDNPLTFLVRSLTAVVNGRALFETIHDVPREELEEGWQRLVKILDYLVNVLPKWAHVHTNEDLNTSNVLVPAVAYLARHGGKFSNEKSLRQFIRWLYAASSWARYSSQTDQRLDHDVSIVRENEDPWTELVNAIIDQRGRIELAPDDLVGRGTQHPFYRMTYVLVKANAAVDWFNGVPLETPHGKHFGIHSHHIFPQSVLYQSGKYSIDNHVHRQLVNEISNRAFLTGGSNLELGARPPADYLPEIESTFPGALQKQFVPLDPALWEVDRYEDFLRRRRQLIASAFNNQMERLLMEMEPPKPRTLEELIAAGESATLEFKSTLRWDVQQQRVNKDLQKVIAKTVGALLNSEGGTLVIGVSDDGEIYGIEADVQSLGRKDLDGFFQAFVQVLDNGLGAEFVPFVKPRFEQRDGKTVCVVEVEASPKPVYLRDGGGPEFHIRAGNTTRALDLEAAHEYIDMHWQP